MERERWHMPQPGFGYRHFHMLRDCSKKSSTLRTHAMTHACPREKEEDCHLPTTSCTEAFSLHVKKSL
ncbi:hypothetical protein E2C01_047149 [Portunus trituberculatus]|uniref:Uncharacterized protein n=1 Tax=Portunus trituberculatus TaxID=210409 RepID=A0A5B7FZN2_PORTR|nr:hypothetical protein [Portunus trituberculatus]